MGQIGRAKWKFLYEGEGKTWKRVLEGGCFGQSHRTCTLNGF